jgi:hypothetical protein
METTKKAGNIKLLLNGIILIFSILTLGVVSFAWFTVASTSVDKVVLNSGNNAMTVDALAYSQSYTTSNGTPVPMAYSKNAGSVLYNASKGWVDGEGNFTVNFNSDNLSKFSFGSLYDNELSVSEKNFPHLYVELRYIKPSLDGFIKASVSNITFATTTYGSAVNALTADSTGTALVYQYRYVTKKNIAGYTYYNNVIQAAEADSTYQASSWNALTTTSFSLFRNDKDLSDYSYDANTTSLEEQCYVPGFAYQYNDNGTNTYYYSKATLLEIRIDPMSWVSYYKAHPTAHASQLNFGVSFTIGLSFSNEAYQSASTTPKVTSTKKEMILGVGQSDTSTLATYNFSSWTSYGITSSNTNVATTSLSGNTLTVTAGSTAGSAIITIKAYLGNDPNASEQASTSISVQVFDGPSLLIDPAALSITRGSIGSISAKCVLFSGTPTITAVSSDPTIAEPSVNGTTITVKGLAKGSANVTITASYNTGSTIQTSTKVCPVTVISLVKTVTAIAVSSLPTTTEYAIGTSFNSSGLVITATYDDASTANVTGYTLNPANGSTLSTLGSQTVTVTYASMTTSFSINVVQSLVTLSSIAITSQPTTVAYTVGNSFSSSGLVITGTYSDNSTAVITGYTLSIDDVAISDGTVLSTSGSKTVVVAYQGLSTSFGITVTAQASNRYYLVTSSSQLTSGGVYLLVSNLSSDYSGSYYAMSTTQNTNNRAPVQITAPTTSGGLTYIDSPASTIEKVTLISSGTSWALQTATTPGYLSSSNRTKNYMITRTSYGTTGDGTLWNITVPSASPYTVSIINTTNTARYLQFNNVTSPYFFSAYENTQVNPLLFKLG